ncbi:hypothetical protein [Actinomadura rudentiformis]|uniref:Uncharacterized protein n=1 Tax=Actinomadura rudentiformis TaxID=359158 RepID=A0A6H9YKU1_9ACTN|nr:hypothetical protein [Actinomadura rudentiformis]KAB2345155.1 hypothetical protein F8566_28190 [Actinomadura rudentiformis]
MCSRRCAQEPLTKAASVLRWEVEKTGYAGYADVALEENGVALHWKGDVPAAMKSAIGSAVKHAPVRVVPARYSQADLRAAITPIYEYMKKHPGGPVRSVSAAGAAVPFSSTRTSVPPGAISASTRSRADQRPRRKGLALGGVSRVDRRGRKPVWTVFVLDLTLSGSRLRGMRAELVTNEFTSG